MSVAPEKEPTRILVVEDSDTQAFELTDLLARTGFAPRRAASLAEAMEALAGSGPFEAILLDLGLPDGSGPDVFRRVSAAAPGVAVVVLTSLDDEEVALRAVQEGAQDYLIKGEVGSELLVRSVRHAIERQAIEAALARSRDDLAAILNLLRIGTLFTDPQGRVTFHSRAADPLLQPGGPATEGRHWTEVFAVSEEDLAASRRR